MAVEIVVPALGESVSEAIVARWMKKAGDAVAVDEALVELETDKVTLEVNAMVGGVLESVLAEVGARVKVGAVLGAIVEGGAPVVSAAPAPSDSPSDSVSAPAPVPSSVSSPSLSPVPGPAARKALAEAGLAVHEVPASGVGGRVTKADVAAALDSGARNIPQEDGGGVRTVREERVPLDPVRRRVIDLMMEEQNRVPSQAVFAEVDLGNLLDLCTTYGDDFEMRHGVALGVMGFFAKAVVLGLEEFPALNATLDGDDIVYRKYYDIAVALATQQGMVMPVVRDVGLVSMAEFEKALGDYAVRARYGQLSLDDLAGGTFSVSNSGGLGAMLSVPVLSAGQSGALGLHVVQDRAVVVDGEIVVRPVMFIALAFDRRLVEEGDAVQFLARVKDFVEDPQRLVIDV